jgi:hypothetical protein
VLQYINEQYPRLKDEKPQNPEFAHGKFPIGSVLAHNSEPNDGFSGYLLRKLPDLAKDAYSLDKSLFYGVSEPNHWLLYVNRFKGVRGEGDWVKWFPTFSKTDLDSELKYYDVLRPIALIADGTFLYYEVWE